MPQTRLVEASAALVLLLAIPARAELRSAETIAAHAGFDTRFLGWQPAPGTPAYRAVPQEDQGIHLTPEQALAVGRRIWQNESGGTISGLTHWNSGEDFASLGIGHFIWYRAGRGGPFIESFPKLLGFLENEGVVLPLWLRGQPPCPWDSKEEFFRDFQSPRMVELRRLLEATIALQARFVADRLEAALPKILSTIPVSERDHVRREFYRVAGFATGVYALVDYVNFKGEGISLTERYHGQGWGLLQVLQGMEEVMPPLEEFSRSADEVLTRRVANSPPARRESRWLPGWRKRVRTYVD